MVVERLRVLAWPKCANETNNPYNKILYSAMSADVIVSEFNARRMNWRGEQVFHVHWPDLLVRGRRAWRIKLRFARLRKTVRAMRAAGVKIVWTVHNLRPHSAYHAELVDTFMQEFVGWVDGFIFLSEDSRTDCIAAYPAVATKPYCIIPHLHYKEYYSPARKSVSRKSLGVPESAKVLLMFGKIREHKGLNELLAALSDLGSERLFLIVAGDPGSERAEVEKLVTSNISASTLFLLEHIPHNQVADLFELADVTILPYQQILNSGSAILSLSQGTPIIAPAMGSLPSLKSDFGEQWVYLYNGFITRDKLAMAEQWLCQIADTTHPVDLNGYSPAEVAAKTERFYRSL